MATDDDVLDAVDDAAELERGRLGGHRLRVVQLSVRHQVAGVTHCRSAGPASHAVQPCRNGQHDWEIVRGSECKLRAAALAANKTNCTHQ